MSKRIVVIGAVALGPKVACRVKRIAPELDVTMVDQDKIISYGGCGIPYYIGGDLNEIKELYSTKAHIVRDEAFFKEVKGTTVFTRTQALSIDRNRKLVRVKDLENNIERDLPYDRLVIATGATPVIPPIKGADLSSVHIVATPFHAEKIKNELAQQKVSSAAVIGGGAIGLEMAEALTELWGIKTYLIEREAQVLPASFGSEMAKLLQNHMTEKGVELHLGESVSEILGNRETGVQGVRTDKTTLACDMVILAVGVRANSQLAREAGLGIGKSGGIVVDEYMRTSDPDIYAGGDCVEIRHLISGGMVHMPLGSLANRQGRVIGTNLLENRMMFRGTVGTFCIKLFDMGAARAGLTFNQAKKSGFDPVHAVIVQSDHAHFYPTQKPMFMKLIADRKTRQVLGVEAIGENGDAVKARVDAISALLPGKITLDVLSNLEVAYSPPYASAMDIVNNAANTLENIIDGYNTPADAEEFIQRVSEENTTVLDVRNEKQSAPYIEQYGNRWLNIPQEELKKRMDELHIRLDEPLYIVCSNGPRAYECQLFLRQKGFENTKSVQGGMSMIAGVQPQM